MENTRDASALAVAVKSFELGSQVVLLRHANSKYNSELAQLLAQEHTDEDVLRVKTKRALRDAPISELGLQQCEETSEVVSKLKVEIVLVSPMKRTLQTAYNVFKSHPNFNNIRFVVVPQLKEGLGSVADIPKNVLAVLKEFKTKFAHLDCSLLDTYNDITHYYLEDISDEFASRILKEKSADASDVCNSNAFDLLVEEIQNCYPRKLESMRSMVNRVNKVKKFVKGLLRTENLEQDSKVVLVTHSNFFKAWTGVWEKPISEYKTLPFPTEFKCIKN